MRPVTAAALTAAAMAWAVRGRSSSVFGPSVWKGVSRRKSIALTFDDGPTPSTPQILDILAEHRARATFFQVGVNVIGAQDLTRAVQAAGHEIGNHSHTHPNFAFERPEFVQDEFARAQEAITDATGQAPVLMRAPYGVRWFGFRDMQRQLGLTGVMWTVIGLDWKLSAPEIAARVLRGVRPGAIVCLHDGRATEKNPDIGQTIESLKRILPALLEKGYHFESASELLCPMTN